MPRNKSNRNITFSQFYCTQCGNRSFDIPRKVGQERKSGHLKKIWCFHCNAEVNFVEVKPFTKYDYEDFLLEFEGGNFTPEGERKQPYGEFKGGVYNEKESICNGGDTSIG